MPLVVAGTDSITVPVGSTVQRGSPAVTGMFRLNSTTGVTEYYNGTNWVSNTIISGTAVASTSGTSIDFTNIPAGVKRITVMFNGVSTSGTSDVQIQVGAGSVTTTGYLAGSVETTTGSNLQSTITSTAGFVIYVRSASASRNGAITISLLGSNTWVASGNIFGGAGTGYEMAMSSGSITLGGTLDRVRITTANGTDTFDAGSINILYE